MKNMYRWLGLQLFAEGHSSGHHGRGGWYWPAG